MRKVLKVPCKRTFLSMAVLILCSCFAVTSCNDDGEGRVALNDAAPASVSNIQQSAGPGEVYFTWTIPASESFMYTKVVYNTSKGVEKYQIYGKDRADENGIMKATISGFASTDPVKFSFYACSVRGNSLQPVEVEAAPDTPAFVLMAESINVEPAYGGADVSWVNESAAPVYIAVDYAAKAEASKSGSVKFKVAANSKGSRFVPFSYGEDGEVLSGEVCVINIRTQDEEENSSEARTFEKTPIKVQKLDRTDWTFPGFVDSYDATIGYSSQEAGGEGGYPNGRVVAMIDGDKNTFWHTAWKQASAYPHFFIIDMGKEVEVTNVVIRRRMGNSGTHIGQTFYTCTEANASNPADPTAWTWDEQGWFAFDATTDTPQLFLLNTPKKARYLKVYFASGDKGSGDFVMISEVNVYGPVAE